MKQFFWQENSFDVAKSVNACLEKMSHCATVVQYSQTSDQPDVSGRDVT
jgi:hypothetical protein